MSDLTCQAQTANCVTTGATTSFQCDGGGVNIQPNANGATTLTISGLPIPSGWINYSVAPAVTQGTVTMSLTVGNTTVNASGNGAVNVSVTECSRPT